MDISNVNNQPIKNIKNKKQAEKTTSKETETKQEVIEEKSKPSSELLKAMHGISFGSNKPVPRKFNKITAPLAIIANPVLYTELNPEDISTLSKALCRRDEETSNLQMQLQMVAKGVIQASSMAGYWEAGQMSEALAEDLDMIYEANKAHKNVNDVYVPELKSQEEGNATRKIGDVFKVADEDKIYVKTDENESRQLDMDKDMFIKLFPPAKRFTTQQQGIGDCYLVSTLGTLMENPKGRIALYEAFHQDGRDVTVKFKNGYGEYKYKNAMLPILRNYQYNLKGATGMKLLEDAYGLDTVKKVDHDFKTVMSAKIAEKQEALKTATDLEKEAIQKSLDGHQKRLNDYLEATADPKRTIVVCRNDNYYSLYYEEDENGMIFTDLHKDEDNTSFFDKASDFYRGALGGYNFEVLERFGFGGFRQLNLDYEPDRQKAEEVIKNFNQNLIMTGGTRYNGERVENPIATKSGIYSFHAYTLKPHTDENGNTKITCTNPWNTSYDADVSLEDFYKFYDSISVVDVDSYGKDLPIIDQPIAYDKDGAVIGENKDDGRIRWFVNAEDNYKEEAKKS